MQQRAFMVLFAFLCLTTVVASTVALIPKTQAQTNIPGLPTCSNLDRPLLLGFMTNGRINTQYIDHIADVGGTAVKQSLNWDVIESQRGQYNWGGFDEMFARAQEKKLVGVALIIGTPSWAKEGTLPAHRALPKKEFTEDYKRFVKAAVQRYPQVVAFEFWNEQNGCGSSIERCGYNDQSVTDYAYWLGVTHDAIKEVNASKLVIIGGLDGIAADKGKDFMEKVHTKPGGRKYDIFSLHPYGTDMRGPIDIEAIKMMHNVVQKPIWITEYGWNAGGSGDKLVTEAQQAEFTRLALIEMSKPEYSYIQAAFFATITDQGSGMLMGLLKRENSQDVKKPAWYAYNEFATQRCPRQATPPNPPQPPPPGSGQVQDVLITIRTHITARAGLNSSDGSNWPELALYLNNAGNYDGLKDQDDCSSTDRPATCGTPNTFQDKLIEIIKPNAQTFTHDTKVSAQRILATRADGVRIPTKISLAYFNDYWNPSTSTDRDVFIHKVEILTQAGEKLLEFTPQSAGVGTTTNFYFDMGVINIEGAQTTQQNGMLLAFDKQLLYDHNHSNFNSVSQNRWPLTQEGSFNIISTDLPRILLERFPSQPAPTNQCVTSTNSTGGTPSKAGLPLSLGSDLIVSSRASSAVKSFTYAFFNANNLTAAGAPQPYCVTGLPASSDLCPAGTGQLIITTTTSGGPIAAFDAVQNIPTADSILTSIRGGALFSKTGSNPWQTMAPITTLPITLSGEVQAVSAITLGDRLILSAWVNNNWLRSVSSAAGYTAQSPLLRSTNVADYNWQKVVDLSTNPTKLPGSGPVQAFGEFSLGNTLIQVYWRGNQEFIRSVPIGSGNMPDFAGLDAQANGGFTQSRTTGNVIGSGSVQALTFIQTSADQVTEIIWRNNQQHSRSIATANFNTAWATTPYGTDGTAPLGGDGFGSGIIVNYDQMSAPDQHPSWVAQHGVNRAPNNLDIAASFVTTDNTQIAASDACTSNVLLSGQLAGDLNKDCRVDIYDYNFALENFNRQCPVGQTCERTTQEDVDRVVANFGNNCQ